MIQQKARLGLKLGFTGISDLEVTIATKHHPNQEYLDSQSRKSSFMLELVIKLVEAEQENFDAISCDNN